MENKAEYTGYSLKVAKSVPYN